MLNILLILKIYLKVANIKVHYFHLSLINYNLYFN